MGNYVTTDKIMGGIRVTGKISQYGIYSGGQLMKKCETKEQAEVEARFAEQETGVTHVVREIRKPKVY